MSDSIFNLIREAEAAAHADDWPRVKALRAAIAAALKDISETPVDIHNAPR